MLGIITDATVQHSIVIYEAEAREVDVVPQEILLEVKIDWTKDRIEEEIRRVFPEMPNTAVAVAKAEGGLVTYRQSDIYKNGVREPSFCAFQIHAPSWEKTAIRLGYGDYRTNVQSCIKMARYIYDNADQSWRDWSAYNNGSYKKYL